MLDGLNPQQKEAVLFIDAPLLLIAGAGSGKTKVLTSKIAYLIKEKGIRANRILAITFTKKAANEMSERVKKTVSFDVPWISTFHAFGVRVLREDIEALGKQYDRKFVIYDTDDSLKIITDIMKRLNMKPKEARMAKEVISKAKQEHRASIVDYIRKLPFPASSYAVVAEEYQKDLEKSNALDYDDLLLYTTELLLNNITVRQKWQERFSFILIDEYQDTNDVQHQIIKLLNGNKKGLFAVGDPFQSIYSWRGSKPTNMLRFIEDFGAAEMKLEKNYRSTKKILKLANKILCGASDMWGDRILTLHTDCEIDGEIESKRNENDREETDYIAKKILALRRKHDYSYSDMAILIRMSFLSRGIESSLMKNNIPYQVVKGFAFYEHAEIRDLVSYLRFIANHKDQAAFERIINIPSRYMGKKALSLVRDHYKTDWIQALKDTKLSSRQRSNVDSFIAIVEKFTPMIEDAPFAVLMELIAEIGYFDYLKNEYKDDHDDRIDNISELSNVLKNVEIEGKSFSEFIEDNQLSSEQDRIGSDTSVKIMTLHAAKGLEFPVIFIPALEEGVLPSARSLDNYAALEEERRLFYVGCTRARERLYLSSAESRMKFGSVSFMLKSRYLNEIKSEI